MGNGFFTEAGGIMKIIKTNDLEIKLTKKIRLRKPEPILWYRQGIFCIIPIEIIKNAYEQFDMYRKYSEKFFQPNVYITWNQGIPVDPKVGHALMETN